MKIVNFCDRQTLEETHPRSSKSGILAKKTATNLLEFTRKFVKSHFAPFSRRNSRKLDIFLEKLRAFAIFPRLLAETLCFCMFFVFLQDKTAFFCSFYMIFELFVATMFIILLFFRRESRNLPTFLFVFTFFVPIFQCFQPNSQEINTFLNVFRSFRALRLCETLQKCARKCLLSRNAAQIAEILIFFASFVAICTSFVLTFAEKQEKTLFLEEVRAFTQVLQCFSLVFCDIYPSKLQVLMNFLVISAVLCYFYNIMRILAEISQGFSLRNSQKSRISQIFVAENCSFLRFPSVFARKPQVLCFFGEFPAKLLETIVKRHAILSNFRDILDIKLVFPQETCALPAESLRKIKKIARFSIIPAESENLREILASFPRIFAFFDKTPHLSQKFLANILEMHAKQQKTAKNCEQITYFCEEKRAFPAIFTDFLCETSQIRSFLQAAMVTSPLISAFFKEILSISARKPHFSLSFVQPSSFFSQKPFSFCAKIVYFSSFYCKDAQTPEKRGSAIVLLGVLRKSRFFLNPADFLVNFGDSFLLLSEQTRENRRFLETFSDSSFDKYQQIIDLMEISLENPGESVISRHEFLENVEKTLESARNREFSQEFVDFCRNKRSFAEISEHFVLIFVGKLEFSQSLSRFLAEIRRNLAKTAILLFCEDENCEKFSKNSLKSLGIVSIFGSFLEESHLEALNIEKCEKVLVLADNCRDSAVRADFLLRKLAARHKKSKICAFSADSAEFLENFARFSDNSQKKYSVLFTNRVFYKVLADYSLRKEFKLFVEAIKSDKIQENALSTLYISQKFANKFKTFGDLVLFSWKMHLPLIPLGISQRNHDFLQNFANKCVINPELTLKLEKGQKILILLKKGRFFF